VNYSEFLSSLWFFPIKSFYVKIFCLSFVMYIISSHVHSLHSLISPVVWINHPIARGGKSPPHMPSSQEYVQQSVFYLIVCKLFVHFISFQQVVFKCLRLFNLQLLFFYCLFLKKTAFLSTFLFSSNNF